LDLSIFLLPEIWIQLFVLIFLEVVLGIDNLVFIAITTDRLPNEKKTFGRRFGLMAALVMRILLLCFATWIISLQLTLFTLPFGEPFFDPEFSGKDIILLVGGAYLIFKGIQEIIDTLSMKDEAESINPAKARPKIGLLQAVGTIAVMDIIFSLDSVITAVGMVDELLIMILAVMIAVVLMIIFANPISEFINRNPEVKLLALAFIVVVGVKLVIKALGFELPIEGSAFDVFDLMLYFAMGFSLILTALQMVYSRRLKGLHAEAREAGLRARAQYASNKAQDQGADGAEVPAEAVATQERAEAAATQARTKKKKNTGKGAQ
jgi:predicted tellurium resistance membrane protein TerC